jgi:PASTA domain
MLLGGASRADAYTGSAGAEVLTADEAASVAGWLEKGGGYTSAPSPVGNAGTVSDLWLSEHRPIPNQPSSTQLWNELGKLRSKATLTETAATVLGRVSLGATAFLVGWQIGTAIREGGPLFGGAKVPGYTGDNGWQGGRLGIYAPGANMNTASQPVYAPALVVKLELPRLRCDDPADNQNGQPWPADLAAAHYPKGSYVVKGPTFTACGLVWSGGWQATKPGHMETIVANIDVLPVRDSTTGPGTGAYTSADLPTFGATPGDGATVQTAPTSSLAAPSAGATTAFVNSELNTPAGHANYPSTWTVIVDTIPPPPPPKVTMPDCDGLTATECAAELESAGFTVTPTIVTTSFDGADLTRPGDAVITTSPAPGESVDPDTAVIITKNPAPDAMPLVLPPPMPGETYGLYIGRLQGLGLVGQAEILTDSTMDPDVAPELVVRTSPRPYTRVAPGTTVTVYANPTSSPGTGDSPISDPDPSPAEGGPTGDYSPPAIDRGGGSCDLEPVKRIDLDALKVPLGDTFPFGVIGWLLGIFGGWTGNGTAPEWTIPLWPGSEGIPLSMEWASSLVDVLRPVFLCLALIGFVWFLASLTLGTRGSAGDNA